MEKPQTTAKRQKIKRLLASGDWVSAKRLREESGVVSQAALWRQIQLLNIFSILRVIEKRRNGNISEYRIIFPRQKNRPSRSGRRTRNRSRQPRSRLLT